MIQVHASPEAEVTWYRGTLLMESDNRFFWSYDDGGGDHDGDHDGDGDGDHGDHAHNADGGGGDDDDYGE